MNLRSVAILAVTAAVTLTVPAAFAFSAGPVPAVTVSAVPAVTVSASPAASVEPTPTPTPTPTPDCKGAVDRRTGAAKGVPFTVCGVEVFSKPHRVTSAYHPRLVAVKVAKSGPSTVRLQKPAGDALKQLFAAAKKAGHTLVVRYAYRTYSWQQAAYRRDHVLTAPAGASEHQSGWAVDLAAKVRGREVRGFSFGTSKAGRWVAANAAKFGFIVRYPKGQQRITGYTYEPWHIRFVGAETAAGVMATPTRTLERYLRIG